MIDLSVLFLIIIAAIVIMSLYIIIQEYIDKSGITYGNLENFYVSNNVPYRAYGVNYPYYFNYPYMYSNCIQSMFGGIQCFPWNNMMWY